MVEGARLGGVGQPAALQEFAVELDHGMALGRHQRRHQHRRHPVPPYLGPPETGGQAQNQHHAQRAQHIRRHHVMGARMLGHHQHLDEQRQAVPGHGAHLQTGHRQPAPAPPPGHRQGRQSEPEDAVQDGTAEHLGDVAGVGRHVDERPLAGAEGAASRRYPGDPFEEHRIGTDGRRRKEDERQRRHHAIENDCAKAAEQEQG